MNWELWQLIFWPGLGLCLGSFSTVLIPRWKAGESGIWTGRSWCGSCHAKLKWYELIPVLSWLLQKGKCRHCQKSVSVRYPLIEISFALLLGWIGTLGLSWGELLIATGLGFGWGVIFWYDVWFRLVDDRVVLWTLGFTLLWVATQQNLSWWSVLAGGIAGGGFFAIPYWLSKGRWMGQGDIGVGMLGGLLLGAFWVWWGIFISYFLGLAICLPLLAAKKISRTSPLPMASFLAAGFLLSWQYGDWIREQYLLVIATIIP